MSPDTRTPKGSPQHARNTGNYGLRRRARRAVPTSREHPPERPRPATSASAVHNRRRSCDSHRRRPRPARASGSGDGCGRRSPDCERATQARRHALARPGRRAGGRRGEAECLVRRIACGPRGTLTATRMDSPAASAAMSRAGRGPAWLTGTGTVSACDGSAGAYWCILAGAHQLAQQNRHDDRQRAYALLGAAPPRKTQVWDGCATACRCRLIYAASAHRPMASHHVVHAIYGRALHHAQRRRRSRRAAIRFLAGNHAQYTASIWAATARASWHW